MITVDAVSANGAEAGAKLFYAWKFPIIGIEPVPDNGGVLLVASVSEWMDSVAKRWEDLIAIADELGASGPVSLFITVSGKAVSFPVSVVQFEDDGLHCYA